MKYNNLNTEKITSVMNPWYDGYCDKCKFYNIESKMCDSNSPYKGIIECKYIALCRDIVIIDKDEEN